MRTASCREPRRAATRAISQGRMAADAEYGERERRPWPIWMVRPTGRIEQFEEAIAVVPKFGGTFTNSVAMGYPGGVDADRGSGTRPANRPRGAIARALHGGLLVQIVFALEYTSAGAGRSWGSTRSRRCCTRSSTPAPSVRSNLSPKGGPATSAAAAGNLTLPRSVPKRSTAPVPGVHHDRRRHRDARARPDGRPPRLRRRRFTCVTCGHRPAR